MNAIRFILDLLKLRLLPDIDDEAGTREWLRNLLAFAEKAAEVTGNKLDDTGVSLLLAAVNSDTAWPKLYQMMHFIFCREHTDVVAAGGEWSAQAAMDDVIEAVQGTDASSVALAVNPALILQIVLAIIELLRKK